MSTFNVAPAPAPNTPRVNPAAVDLRAQTEKQVAVIEQTGFWAKFWYALKEAIPALLGVFIAAFLTFIAMIAEYVGKSLIIAQDIAKPWFGRVAKIVVKDVLDVDVSENAFDTPGGSAGRGKVTDDIAGAVWHALLGDVAKGQAGSIAPSDAQARNFFNRMMKIAIQDWVQSGLTETFSLGQIEAWGKLGNNVTSMLGLGRVADRALAPMINVGISTPLEWLVNKNFRPRLLSPSQARRAYQRGAMTRAAAVEECARQGWSDARIDALFAESVKRFTPSQIDYLFASGAWNQKQAINELVEQDYTPDQALTLLALLEDQRMDGHRRSLINAAAAAYVSRDIDLSQFTEVMDTVTLPTREKQLLFKIAAVRRSYNRPNVSDSEFQRAVKQGLRQPEDYRQFLGRLGYNDSDIDLKVHLLIEDMADKQAAENERIAAKAKREEAARNREAAAAARRQAIADQLAFSRISLAGVERLVLNGTWSLDQYRAWLASRKYGMSDQNALVDLLADRLSDKTARELRALELRKQAEARRLSIGTLDDSLARDIITEAEYLSRLRSLGFAAADQEILLTRAKDKIAEAAAAASARAEARQRLAEKDLNLSQFEQAVRRGLRTADEFYDFLIAAGFDEVESSTLVGLVDAQIADDEAARVRREELAALAAKRDLSIAQEESAVLAGVKTIDQYRGALAGAGFDVDDQDTLVSLLMLRIDAAEAAEERRAEAARRLATRSISMSDLETAVKYGIVPVNAYRAYLDDAGFTALDADILVASLTREIQDAAAARKARAEAALKKPEQRVTLAQFERAVRGGFRSIADYRAHLTTAGYKSTDVDLLSSLLVRQLAIDELAKRRRAEIEAQLGERRISLSDFEQSVVSGITTLAEYQTYLQSQGFGSYDQSILIELLRDRVDAAAEAQE